METIRLLKNSIQIIICASGLLLNFSCQRENEISNEVENIASKDFYSKIVDADTIAALELEFCRDCNTLDEAIAYEESLGSKELKISRKMKYEWKSRRISITFPEEKYGHTPREWLFEDVRIFIRANEPFQDYSMAMIYDPDPNRKNISLIEAWIYPGDNFFGFHKSEEFQSFRSISFPEIPAVSSHRFVGNYISVLKWMESFSNLELGLQGCNLDFPFYMDLDLSVTNFVYEEDWMEDMIFYTALLSVTDEGYETPFEFNVLPHAPLDAYYNYVPDDIYSSYYQLDVEDLAFRIKIFNDHIHLLTK